MRVFALKESSELRNRNHNVDRNLREALEYVEQNWQAGKISQAKAFASKAGLWMVSQLDQESAIPTWIAGYSKASKTMSHEDAVYAADKLVRNAHGASSIADMSAVLRADGLARLFTPFYGFFNHMYNQLENIARVGRLQDPVSLANLGLGEMPELRGPTAGLSGSKIDYPFDVYGKKKPQIDSISKFQWIAWATLGYIALDTAAHELFRPTPEHKGESLGAKAAAATGAFLGGMVPGFREATFALETHQPLALAGPAASVLQSLLVNPAQDVSLAAQGKKTPLAVRHAVEAGTIALGLPGGRPLGRGAQFLWDYNIGKQRADTLQDFTRGLITGKSKPRVAR